MAGYANRVTKIEFPDLTEEGQPPLFITIKNPKVIPPSQLFSDDVEVGPDGRPLDAALAARRSAEVIASLVVAWRMYDASDFAVDAETGEPLDQQPLPLPATPELVEKLPTEAVLKLNKVLTEAVDPQ